MVTSNEYDKVLNAVAIVKGKLQALAKKADNPYYSSKYVELNDFLNEVEPKLAEEGLMLTQSVVRDSLGDYVDSRIWHVESGQFLSSTLSVLMEKKDMQKLGSGITYARRYTLQAMLSIQAVDDDGNLASYDKAPASKPLKASAPKTVTKEEAKKAAGGFSKPKTTNNNVDTQPTTGGW